MFGKLSWSAIPFDQPIPLITSIVLIATILGVLTLITVKGWWPYLWREWITTVDHKRIGIMYCLLGARDAGPRLCGRDHDAHPAGGRDRLARATCSQSTTTRSSRRTARS